MHTTDDPDALRPVRDAESTAYADPSDDPAQAEWEGHTAEPGTATGADPAEIPDEADEIPAADLPRGEEQPETQEADPLVADLGQDGEGDLAPEDL